MKRRGQGLVEYALIFALISLAAVATLSAMGNQVILTMYDKIVGSLTTAENVINTPTGTDATSPSEDTSPSSDG